ncbi:flagellar M-ring protein FliF [Myxococcaceae bacterium GXIMD 01537]
MFSRRCLILLLLLGVTGCRERIQHGLDERQANELQTVLAGRGLDARKVQEAGKKPTWAIEVADEHATRAVRILAELGLPRPEAETGCDVFGGGGLVRTPVEEQVCRVRVLERGLEKTLEGMEGVLLARVHLVMPPPPRPGLVAVPSKASAMLRVEPGWAAKLRQSQESIRGLLAGGVEGLAPEAVSLVVDEVLVRVESPMEDGAPLTRLRVLLVVLGLAVTGLAVGLVLVTLRLRYYRARAEAPPVVPPVPARPVVTPAATRRVA